MKNLVMMFYLLIFGVVMFYGCSKNNNPVASSSGAGMMKVQMTDSPAGYSEVNVVIDSVQAHISTSDSSSGWFTLNNKPATYNLLLLVNGTNAVIGDDTLQAGYYDQIRLFVGSGSNVVLNGQTFALTTPSGSQSGIKLNVNATVQTGIAYLLTLDFDANQSIVVTGSPVSPKYILKPVIRVVASATTGIISGLVSPSSVTTDIWAMDGTDTVSTSTDASGGFSIQYLSPGSYNILMAPHDTTYKDTTIANVAVTASNTTSIGTVILTKK